MGPKNGLDIVTKTKIPSLSGNRNPDFVAEATFLSPRSAPCSDYR